MYEAYLSEIYEYLHSLEVVRLDVEGGEAAAIVGRYRCVQTDIHSFACSCLVLLACLLLGSMRRSALHFAGFDSYIGPATAGEKRRGKNANQFTWVLLLKAHRSAGCLTILASAF